MAASLRSDVLNCFRRLHRARRKVFQNDSKALEAAREKINIEFRRYRNATNTETISELLKFCNQVEEMLRTTVVQAIPTTPQTYQLRLTKDTAMFDNVPYRG